MIRSHQEVLTPFFKDKSKKTVIGWPPSVHRKLVILGQELGMNFCDLILLASIRFLKKEENWQLVEQSNYDSKVDPLDRVFSEIDL